MITFVEEGHKYSGLNVKWESATGLISKLHPHFPTDEAANNCSTNENSKYYGLTPDEIKEIWRKENTRSTDEGSLYHNKKEDYINSKDKMIRNGMLLDVLKSPVIDGVKHSLPQKLRDGIYPEYIVYREDLKFCGQVDLLIVQNGFINILDYKTNKELSFHGKQIWEFDPLSKKRKPTDKRQMMFDPVSHLEDCNFNHYQIQLSLYMFLMLMNNPHLKPGKMAIQKVDFKKIGENKYGYPIHEFDEDGIPVINKEYKIPVNYLEKEVGDIISSFRPDFINF